jgi:hypothetical protein
MTARSPLPGPGRVATAARRRAAWASLLLLALARPAPALEIAAGPPRERAGWVWVDARLDGLFAPRVESSLARGMPATLRLHAELWRQRAGWFDRLESAFDAELRLRYDFRADAYRLERDGARPLVLAGLDSVRTALSRPLPLPVARFAPLDAGSRYYVVVSATLKPLSLEDVRQVEGWLSGEVGDTQDAPWEIVTGLPFSLFEAARNFAGFGDEHARAVSEPFGPRDLPRAAR